MLQVYFPLLLFRRITFTLVKIRKLLLLISKITTNASRNMESAFLNQTPPEACSIGCVLSSLLYKWKDANIVPEF